MQKIVLIFGNTGQVGYELYNLLRSRIDGEYSVIGIDRSCDVTKIRSVKRLISTFRPDIIVNCTAYTDVEKSESKSKLAYEINEKAVKNILTCAQEIKCGLIHYSTDYVFDGKNKDAYQPQDKTNPLSVYGKSKLAGENVFTKNLEIPWAIIRTSWVYSNRRKNFVRSVLRLAKEKKDKTITIVDDQRGCPTSSKEIARGTFAVIKGLTRSNSGIYHFTGQGNASWYEFAKEIIKNAEERGFELNLKGISPVKTDTYPTIAKRPQHSVLNCDSFDKIFKYERKPWLESLNEVLDHF